MSDETSARLALPLLQTGQAQKELTHNEALALLDLAVQASVEAVEVDTPPDAPVLGQCWIVGAEPTGVWTGRRHAFAGWTTGGWRFIAARAGMTAWSIADGAIVHFDGDAWIIAALQPAILPPTGGATIDSEARATISAVLVALRAHGLIVS